MEHEILAVILRENPYIDGHICKCVPPSLTFSIFTLAMFSGETNQQDYPLN